MYDYRNNWYFKKDFIDKKKLTTRLSKTFEKI